MPEPLTANKIADMLEQVKNEGELQDYDGSLTQLFADFRALAETTRGYPCFLTPTERCGLCKGCRADSHARRVLEFVDAE